MSSQRSLHFAPRPRASTIGHATPRLNDLGGPNNVWSRELSGDLTHTPIVDTSFNPPHERETLAGSLELVYESESFTTTYISSYTDTVRTAKPIWISPRSSFSICSGHSGSMS